MANGATGVASSNAKYFLYVGAYTQDFIGADGLPMGAAKGICTFLFEGGSGRLSHRATKEGLYSPTWLVLHPNLPVLYALERWFDLDHKNVGAVAAYSIDPATGFLDLLSRTKSGGASPPHMSVHPSGRHAYAVHFEGGQLVSFPLHETGAVGAADRIIQHRLEAGAADASRHALQRKARPHQVLPHVSGRYLHVADLGMDVVFTYATNSFGALTDSLPERVALPAGTGPRHQALSRCGRYLFVSGQLNSSLNVLALEAGSGRLTFLRSYATTPPDYVPGPDHDGAAEIGVHSQTGHIYVSNRGHDSIAVFSFDEAAGVAKLEGWQPAFGRIPRSFGIDPAGRFIVIANQQSNRLLTLPVDELLRPDVRTMSIDTPTPVSMVFFPSG